MKHLMFLILIGTKLTLLIGGGGGVMGSDDGGEEPEEEDVNSVKCDTKDFQLQSNHLEESDLLSFYLNEIQERSVGTLGICNPPDRDFYRLFPGIRISVYDFKLPKEKADLIAFFIPKINSKNVEDEIQKGLHSLGSEPHVEGLRYVTSSQDTRSPLLVVYDKINPDTFRRRDVDERELVPSPWYFNAQATLHQPETVDKHKFDTLYNIDHNANVTRGLNPNLIGYWTWPYFKCTPPNSKIRPPKWLISYTTAFRTDRSFGLLSFDVDLTHFPINQCELKDEIEGLRPMVAFHGTHKCDRATMKCKYLEVEVGEIGWLKGSYQCICKGNHHAFTKKWNNTVEGVYLETKWCLERFGGNVTGSFTSVASCQPCPPGCPDCTEKESCMADVNYPFRLTILSISVLCSLGALGLILVVFQCRKHRIFSASSPIFLCICLFGCSVMYTEMGFLFPVLSMHWCIGVKWTRHLGFAITYTALYMKLCRVYLTFRVKSAHRIKLTEKHLLHWMSPIMVIMLLYLFAWTISDPPNVEVMRIDEVKRLYQCVYNWWDHVLSVGEIIFLAYGVFICWRIRENQDAQFISYSIYNIATVNCVFVTLHLIVLPKADPDIKYLLAFFRVQMSTTFTIALVLGSKLYRAVRGDYPTIREIANSANGFGGEMLDLGEENLQLKEELQKMAFQMERLKSYAMTKNNPHISHHPSSMPPGDIGKMDNFTSL